MSPSVPGHDPAPLHADALAALRTWPAPTPSQAALRDRYVAHLEAHPDGTSRRCRPDHLTASTLVLSADHGQVLLTLHRKARRWFQLGGHCEDDDTTLGGAAAREAREESGLTGLVLDPVPVHLDEHAVPFCRPRDTDEDGAGDSAGTRHLDVRYVAVAVAGSDLAEPDGSVAVSPESLDLRWWPVDRLPDPDLAEPVRLAAQRAQLPAASE